MNGETGVRSFGPTDIPEGQQGYDQLAIRVAAIVPRQSASNPDEPFDLNHWCKSKSTAPFTGYALCAAEEAVQDAGIGRVGSDGVDGGDGNGVNGGVQKFTTINPTRAGVSIGSGMGHISDITNAGRLLERGTIARKLSPFFVPRVLCNAAAGQVSMAHDFRGPNRTSATACAAGAHAIGDAFRSIQRGDADVMLCGGTESCVDAVTIAGFARARALADPKAMGLFVEGKGEGNGDGNGENNQNNHTTSTTTLTSTDEFSQDYTTTCRPFDSTRGGFVVGEGAGVLVLESYEHAVKRGVTKIYAEIRGYGQASDAYHVTMPPGDGAGAASAMRAALHDAGVDADSVSYVNAHATGTKSGDAAETAALIDVFGDRFSSGQLPVSSTKGAVGHLLGAAGAVEAAFCALSLFENETPPTLNLTGGDGGLNGLKESIDSNTKGGDTYCPPVGADLVREKNRKTKNSVAVTNSFGFGGTNASLVFVKAPPIR